MFCRNSGKEMDDKAKKILTGGGIGITQDAPGRILRE